MKLFNQKKLSKLGTYLRFISDTFDPEISWNEARMSSEIVLNDGVWMERERERGREKQRKNTEEKYNRECARNVFMPWLHWSAVSKRFQRQRGHLC